MKAVPPVTDLLRLLLTAAGAILFLSLGYTEMAGSDLWWHIGAGRELVQTASPWMIDRWSFSAHGGDWLNHEWLADIIFYAVTNFVYPTHLGDKDHNQLAWQYIVDNVRDLVRA